MDPAEGKRLRKLSRERGAPVGEMVRRAIASWLQDNAPDGATKKPIKALVSHHRFVAGSR